MKLSFGSIRRSTLCSAVVLLIAFSGCKGHDHHGDAGHDAHHGAHAHDPHDSHGHAHDEHGSHEEHEDITEIAPEAAAASGIATAHAAAATLRPALELPGRVYPSEHRIAHITPRFPGVVLEGRKHVGDRVEKGEVMAVVESNESLQSYELRAQISGTVIDGHLIPGEFISQEQPVFVIADIGEVWVDVRVPKSSLDSVAVGRKLNIRYSAAEDPIPATVDYIAPFLDDITQTRLLRAVVQNNPPRLLPGAFVSVELVVEEIAVPLAVQSSAVQNFEGSKVVFIKEGERSYRARPIVLGRSDGTWSEVLKGLSAGEEYVSQNSFIIKADLLKSAAAHEH